MRIKISASVKSDAPPTPGPYKTIDIVHRDSPYQVGDITHYGEVVLILPPLLWPNNNVEQGVVVKLDPLSLGVWCEESVAERPPSLYDKIQFFPISGSCAPWALGAPLIGPYHVFPSENLTIENVSDLIKPDTFSLWRNGCHISKHTAESLDSVNLQLCVATTLQIRAMESLSAFGHVDRVRRLVFSINPADETESGNAGPWGYKAGWKF